MKGGGDKGPGSTAAVLWLMIMLVFLPIAAAHVYARLHGEGSDTDPAVLAAAPH